MEKPFVSKDIYKYLMNFADDRTVLNMLSVNQQFNNDKFLKEFIEKRYPFFINLKNTKYEKLTWKQFFITMIYYLSKLQEEYQIPYIPFLDPKYLYEFAKKYTRAALYRKILGAVIKYSDLNLYSKVYEEAKKYTTAHRAGIIKASMLGKKDIVQFLLDKITKEDLKYVIDEIEGAKNIRTDIRQMILESYSNKSNLFPFN